MVKCYGVQKRCKFCGRKWNPVHALKEICPFCDKRLVLLLLFFLVPFVGADLLVSPLQVNLSLNRSMTSVYGVELFNNNSFPVYNVSFSNVSGFVFPRIPFLGVNQSVLANFSVVSDSVGQSVFVSVVSFEFFTVYNLSPRVYHVNVTGSGFVPDNLVVGVNDSVVWHNLLSEDVSVRDLGSGFPRVDLLANSSFSSVYSSPAGYSFYLFPLGFTGGLSVVPLNGSVLAHNSVFDVRLVLFLDTVLPGGSYELVLLMDNFSLSNNETVTGVLSVRNLQDQPVFRVNLSGRWMVFNDNLFDLDSRAVRYVQFNFTPFVDRTNLTNRSYDVLVNASSLNAGVVSDVLRLFLYYANLDEVVINNTVYTINRLSVRESIEFCIQNPADNECLALVEAFRSNVTVIREIPAVHELSEDDIRSVMAGVESVSGVSQRTENSINRIVGYVDSVLESVDNNSREISLLVDRQNSTELAYVEKLSSMKSRYVLLWILIGVVLLFLLILKIIVWYNEFEAKKKTFQI